MNILLSCMYMNPNRIGLQIKPSQFKRSFSLLLFLYIFLHTHHLQAQNLSFYAGPSVPFGLYADNNITRKEAGFAKTGYHVGFLLEDQRKVRLLNTFFQFSYNQNGIDGDVIRNFLMINNPNIKGSDITAPWRQFLFIPGIKANWFKPGYDLYAKAGIGFAMYKSFTQIQYYDTLRFVVRDNAASNGLVLNAGLGININVTSHISINTGMDMMYGRPNYGKISFSDGANNKVLISDNEEVVPFQSIQWHFGLRFFLGKK